VSRVTDLQLPAGRYLTCPIDVSPDAGGQTRALLMRNRLFVSEAGISPLVLSFSARNDLTERRQRLLELGLIVEEISTPNIYEHYREHGWGATSGPVADPIPVDSFRRHDETFPDGSPWRRVYQDDDGRPAYFDYLHEDGSPFLRIPKFIFQEPSTWPKKIQQLDRTGEVVGEFGAVGHWFRRWIRELTEDQRSFVFVDSRFNAQHIVPMRAPNVHLIYVLHNIHVLGKRHWSSETTHIYRRLLDRVDGMDAMVTLTDRQRDDIAARRGRTDNLFVVPNPVDLPPAPEDQVRDPALVAIVARLEHQKRLEDAIRAFALVVEQVPTARLDIYGSGKRRRDLQQEIDRLGLGGSVTLKGHDPLARDALWRASAFLMTSSYEGYPLSTLESLSHGCPVVSYDIKYGPREQITDGVDGYLVERGDIAALAERVIRLLRSPQLVAEMSAAATQKAAQHSKARFVQTWQGVLEGVVDRKPRRTTVDRVDVDITDLRLVSPLPRLPAPVRGRSLTEGRATAQDRLVLTAEVTVEGRSRESTLESAVWSLAAVDHASGTWTDLPLDVRRDDNRFTVTARPVVADLVADAPPGADVRLRLRMVWHNSSWQTFVKRPPMEAGIEVSFHDGEVLTVRAPGTREGSPSTRPARGRPVS